MPVAVIPPDGKGEGLAEGSSDGTLTLGSSGGTWWGRPGPRNPAGRAEVRTIPFLSARPCRCWGIRGEHRISGQRFQEILDDIPAQSMELDPAVDIMLRSLA